jgi:hypothetical protein
MNKCSGVTKLHCSLQGCRSAGHDLPNAWPEDSQLRFQACVAVNPVLTPDTRMSLTHIPYYHPT